MIKAVIDVEHIAKLANLPITQKEVSIYTHQLQQVLEYMKELTQADTSKVAPTFQTIDQATNVLRKDEVSSPLTQEEALSTAKKTHNGYFVTDHVFGINSQKIPENITPKKQLDAYNAILTRVKPNGSLAHKDLFVTKGVETTAGSKVLQGYVPQYSGTIVSLLEAAHLTTKYKANLDAWGHGSSGENSDFGPTQNPWDARYVPGGSSSGSAAAVAAGLVDIATGTDTGSSIRLPASFTNTTGIKTTYGALSRYGVIAFVSSLDCPGLIARSAQELEKYYQLVAKVDPHDASTYSPIRHQTSVKKVKTIGLPQEYFGQGIDRQVAKLIKQAAEGISQLGIKIKSVSLPHTKYGVAAYYIIAPTEASSNLARYDGIRYGHSRACFGAEAKRRIMLGTYSSSAGYADRYYDQAAKIRTLIINDFHQAFKQVDLLLAPVSPTPPFKLGAKTNSPLQMYLSDALTIPINLAGIPALSLPCGFINKLPIGMQLIGPRWSEPALFSVGKKYQTITDWHTRKPKL